MKHYILHIFAFLTLLTSCSLFKKTTSSSNKRLTNDNQLDFTILQLNDVYEIAPIENGKAGGLARVATIRKQLLQENKNTITVLSGDFVNPSIIGTLKFEGKGIKGRQMIETMNALGVDYVTFGNHEFDLDLPDLQNRLNESNFTWINNNAFLKQGDSISHFYKIKAGYKEDCPETLTLNLTDVDGTQLKLGIFGVVLDANKKDYIQYKDAYNSAKTAVDLLSTQAADVTIGVTHLNFKQDLEIARQNPTVALILGGHEHSNMKLKEGNVIITKADANAKTVYVHKFHYDKSTKYLQLDSKLVPINDQIQEDSAVAVIVKKWTDIAETNFMANGIDPRGVVTDLKEPLDARDEISRNQQCPIGAVVANAMIAAAKQKPDCAFFNGGSLRLDDVLRGKITQSDIVRLMPFGGSVFEMDILGSELQKVLSTGPAGKGSGMYLQWVGIQYNESTKSFQINNSPLDPAKQYHIATNDYLFSGKANGLDFFKPGNPNITNISKPNPTDTNDIRNDIRKTTIEYLKKH